MRSDPSQRWLAPPCSRLSCCLAMAGALVLLGAGCGAGGSYELHWTIGCDNLGDSACTITSARGCSRFGLDGIEVLAVQGFEQSRAVFPCFSTLDGAVGRGPELEEGPANLQVSGLSAGGQVLTSGAVDVAIPASDFQVVLINLPAPPPCADGVDNDADGLVDVHDPGCEASGGEREEE